MVVDGDEALRWILSILPPVSAMLKARFAIVPGVNFWAEALMCTRLFFWAKDSIVSEAKETAISTLSFSAHWFRSSSTACACAGSSSIRTVSINRERLITCSMSKTLIENGSRAQKRALKMPGSQLQIRGLTL